MTHHDTPGAGTVNSDTLCMDATDSKIVVAGYNSQKVSQVGMMTQRLPHYVTMQITNQIVFPFQLI